MSIHRPPYVNGLRCATCENCGLAWVESEMSVELVPGTDRWTRVGERNDHECPEPLPFEVARSLAQMCSQPGAEPIHPRLAARIRLGLAAGEDTS